MITHQVETQRAPRVRVDIHVPWGWTEDCYQQGRMTSLSATGLFLQTETIGERGRRLYVRFWAPGEETLYGEVRYYLDRVGMGVEFVGLTERQREALAQLVEDFTYLA